MKKNIHHTLWLRSACAIVLCFLASQNLGLAENLKRGEALFETCSACHNFKAEGNGKLKAPALAGLKSWYIEAQLNKFKKGIRGYHPSDAEGLRMRPMARTLNKKGDVKAVSDYIATLKPKVQAKTLHGDAKLGKALFVICSTCHGKDAKGIEAQKSPSLVDQSDWYLYSQINRFKKGMRGNHKEDLTGKQMQGMANTLLDDKAIVDVIAYIKSLK